MYRTISNNCFLQRVCYSLGTAFLRAKDCDPYSVDILRMNPDGSETLIASFGPSRTTTLIGTTYCLRSKPGPDSLKIATRTWDRLCARVHKAHEIGASADYGYDSGEFSGLWHDQMAFEETIELLTLVSEAFNVPETAINNLSINWAMEFCHNRGY